MPTQREIAERAGMTEGYLSAFLLGQKDIKSGVFLKLISVMPNSFKILYYNALAEILGIEPENADSKKKLRKKQKTKVMI
ncbi:MAG: hypothetical protein J7647_22270 [Cyanobacteria bacterium SBLK]|nr:hypothetical protein [Cyanobacteria bacterium SBLK]